MESGAWVDMNVLIRLWSKQDIVDVRHITWQTWLATYAEFIPVNDLRTYFDSHYSPKALSDLCDSPSVNGYIAERAGVRVGYVKTLFNRDENRFYISSLYVLPEYQGQGVGTRLFQAAEECALTRHLDSVWLGVMTQNAGTLAWYKSLGFQFVEEAPFTMGDTTVRHLVGWKHIHGSPHAESNVTAPSTNL